MTTQEFQRKLFHARRGDRIIYHTGDLQYDRMQPDARTLRDLANIVWGAYKSGKALLFQKRLGKNEFAYMAVKL
jgi:hypothetical protein